MCFSAQASFGSALFLTGMGVAALSQTRSKQEWLLGSLPLLFALQQTMEGIMWTANTNAPIINYAAYLFLMIASAWPTLIPVAVWLMEKNNRRATDMHLFIAMGIIYTCAAYAALLMFQVHAEVTDHIAYVIETPEHTPYRFLQFWYLIAVSVPPLITTTRRLRLFGGAALLSFAGSYAWQSVYFTSVWCFFAALLSSLIVYVLYKNKREAV